MAARRGAIRTPSEAVSRSTSLKAAGAATVQGGRTVGDPTVLLPNQATLKLPHPGGVTFGTVTAKPASKIPSVADDGGEATEQSRKLSSLESRVKQISSHLEEEMRARAKQRELMDNIHAEELRKVEDVSEELNGQMAALAQFVVDFKAKYTRQLHGVFDALQGQLDGIIDGVVPRLATLEAKAQRMREGIQEEREERLLESERVLAPLREQLARLGAELEREQEVRKANAVEIDRKMREAVDMLNAACEAEEVAREHKHEGLSAEITHDLARLERKQNESVKVTTRQLVSDLEKEQESEQGARLESQDPIVKLLTNFVEQFQSDIKERSGS